MGEIKKPRPPKWINRILDWYCREEYSNEIRGDLMELYDRWLENGRYIANIKYVLNSILFMRMYNSRINIGQHSNQLGMFKNYFKIGYRNLLRNKGYSVINISGLTVGIAITMFIGLWIKAELSYNESYDNYDRIAQVLQHKTYNGDKRTQNSIPFPLGEELTTKYDSDFKYVVMSDWTYDHILSNQEKSIIQMGSYMDVQAPDLLSLEMIKGSRDGLLDPHSILLSEATAKALFGDLDPIGQTMEIDNELTVKVSGIYSNLPSNSSFGDLYFIAPWELYVSSYDWVSSAKERQAWDENSYQLFVQIADRTVMTDVSEKIKNVKYDHLNEYEKSFKPEIFLHPMSDWYLRSKWENGVNTGGLIQYVWLFGIIGVFVLALACVNFMNLSTARSEKRAKEIGIRKSIGTLKGQLVQQFLCESFFVVVLAFLLAILLVATIMPFASSIAGYQVELPLADTNFWLISVAFILITGLLAGSYPALYLSSLKPIKALKGTFKTGASVVFFRRALVVFQFSVSVLLIIGTIVVFNQIQYSKERPLGYDKNGVITIELSTSDFEGKYDLLRNELINSGGIVDMTESSSPMTTIQNTNGGFSWEGKDPNFNTSFSIVYVTHDYGNTVGWEMMEGRDFSREISNDSTAYILNEAAVAYMGIENPVGQHMKWGRGEHEVLGVVKDMLMESPFKSVAPTVYIMGYDAYANYITLKLNPEQSVFTSL
ncbi:MAG: ABC transporter permease, partial [Bacteroidota bacterium]